MSILTTIGSTVKRTVIKESPKILLASGVAGFIGTCVLSVKTTLKSEMIFEAVKDDIINTKEIYENKPEYKKELTKSYAHGAKYIAKAYAPTVALGTASIACICLSNKILDDRMSAYAAAYTAAERSFKAYRQRVAETYGEEAEKDIRYATKTVKIEDETRTGKKPKFKDTKIVDSGIEGYSEYARFFDESCTEWDKDPEYNLAYLLAQQKNANDMLQARGKGGWVVLNEIYDMLGIPRTKAGMVVGWMNDPDNPNIDNYIDFGIYNVQRERNRAFVNGYENVILLDFNVDGDVFREL